MSVALHPLRTRPSAPVCPLLCRARRPNVNAREVLDCYVYGAEGDVKGVCHFIGGAFGGAVPPLVYPVLLSELAANGYTVVATPFAATFKHLQCATKLRQDFSDTLAELRTSPMAQKVPIDAPVHGIGHSFGALAHSLIAADAANHSNNPVASNVLISFNNKAVAEAIPIPGFLNTVTAAFEAYDRSPLQLLPEPLPIVKEVVKTLLSGIPPTAGLSRRTVDDALDQLASVFGEIRDGVVDFEPPPAASAELIASNYAAIDTLLLQFTNDTIDESSTLRSLIERSPAGNPSFQTIPGTHLTPCIGDAQWISELLDVTLDVELAETLQRDAVTDTRDLVETILTWLDRYCID